MQFFLLYTRWLDKLGLAARLNQDVVIRQTFFGGSYALIGTDLQPNPVRRGPNREHFYFAFARVKFVKHMRSSSIEFLL